MKKIILPTMDAEKVADQIGEFIVKKVLEIGTTGAVIGLSGGVDSTTVAALAKRAFDKFNLENPEKKLELVGYMLPSGVNAQADEDDAVKVAKRLGMRYEIQDIEPIVKAFENTNPEVIDNPYDRGNLMSRIRANVLSTNYARENKFVIGTGNKDEDFGIGYYTLFGDGAVHISPIGNLPKRLVREMATYLGFEDLANRVPTAGLEAGQTDFTDLGYDCDAVEIVTEGLTQGIAPEELENHAQVKEMIQPQLVMGKKFDDVKGVVRDILKRHAIALKKMQIIHPPVAEINLDYEE